VSRRFEVPEQEILFRTSRAAGPGGQHVNKTETRVEALWDVARSPSLGEAARARLRGRLASRIDQEGILRVVAADERSQHRNREIALARMRDLVARALAVPRPRVATRPTAGSRERRIGEKRRRGALKKLRRREGEDA
jgi:ribosome-associated protein